MINSIYMKENDSTKEFLKFASNNFLHKEKLLVKDIENGLVLPLKKSEPGGPLMGYGGVLDECGDYVQESAQIGKGDTLPRFVGGYEYNHEEECFFDESVIYIGAFPPHWGHFLVDMVYRFWVFDQMKEPYRIVYCSEMEKIDGVYLEFLQLLGVKKEQLWRIEKPSRFRHVYIPQPGYMACDYYTIEYRNVFHKIVNNLPNNLNVRYYEKIYLSRAHFGEAQNKEIGERNIEYNFQKNGFHVLYMEELSLYEQIYYINHCKIVAALSGTLCHNILFAGKDTKLIILNKTHFINTHQVLIDQMMNIPVTYIDVYKEPYKHFPVSYGGGPFLIDSKFLEDYFAEQKYIYYPQSIGATVINYTIYNKMCLGVKTYKLYEKAYYRLCKHRYIISFFRKLKQMVEKRKEEHV